MRRLLRLLGTLCAGLCLLLLIGCAGVLSYARVTGSQLVVVTGGSMIPTYGLGEGLVVRPLRADEPRPGSIITFRSPRGPLTTRRVVALRHRDGRPYVQTKATPTPTPIPTSHRLPRSSVIP